LRHLTPTLYIRAQQCPRSSGVELLACNPIDATFSVTFGELTIFTTAS
jgi:hypothetical protein